MSAAIYYDTDNTIVVHDSFTSKIPIAKFKPIMKCLLLLEEEAPIGIREEFDCVTKSGTTIQLCKSLGLIYWLNWNGSRSNILKTEDVKNLWKLWRQHARSYF